MGEARRVVDTNVWTTRRVDIPHHACKRRAARGGVWRWRVCESASSGCGYGGYVETEGVGGYHGTSNAASRKSPGPFISSFPHSSPYYKPRLSHGRGPTHTTLPHTRWVSLYNLFTPNAAWSRTVHPRSQPMFTLMPGWARSAATHLV